MGRFSDDEASHDEDETLRTESDGEDYQEPSAPRTAQDRKKEALYAPIANLVSAIGGFEEFRNEDGQIYTAYSLGDQVVGCLKDLKRFWRMDEKDEDRTVARIFFEVGLLKNELIPILLSTLGTSPKGDRIALACVELMGAMTWPINVVEELRDAQEIDQLTRTIDYTSLISAQMSYKAAILRTGSLRAMFQLMSPSLSKTQRERSEKDNNIISLVLHTFRNLAFLKDKISTTDSADAIELSTLQSEYIRQLTDEHIFDLLIAIAANSESSEYASWNMVTLDILHLIFRGVKPAELMVPKDKVTENRLKDLLDSETSKRRAEARKGNTRHSRFGTTLSLQSNGRKYVLHKQSALSIGPEKSLDKVKKSKAKRIREDDDLQPPVHLRADAIECLYNVGISFLDSAFNPFFASVLKDIRMERSKVTENDAIRFLFLGRFFLEFFLLVYKDERERGVDPQSEEGHDFDLVAEMTEPQCIGFITKRMRLALDDKPVQWLELHAGIDCFIQILLVVDALANSGVEANIDVAEILQNKLYYEAETLDMVITVIHRYSTQSLKYLDSVMHLSYVLLRMLEKYSKSKAYMYVRKKKSRARKRKSKRNTGDDEGDGVGQFNEEEEEMDRGAKTYGEHTFEFEKFEAKFADEATLQTCMLYLEGYQSFTDIEQMKRIVGLMHRQAIKAKSEGLFFKPTVFELFQRILDDQTISTSRDPAHADLRKLIEYILKKFFKAAKENHLLLVEIFFPKSRSQLSKLRLGGADPYATSDDEGPGGIGNKFAGEIEVEPGFSLSQQIGIAITSIMDDDQAYLLDFVKDQLALAATARHEIVLTTDGSSEPMEGEDDDSDEAIRRKAARLQGPSKDAVALFTPHNIGDYPSDAERKAVSHNSKLKLLLRLLKWESTEVPDSLDITWAIPTTIMPSTLDSDIKMIENFILDPVDPNGKTAADLLRKKRKVPVRRRRARSESEEGLPSDGEDAAPKKRQKKRKEEQAAYKSAQFIDDSDDESDAERDAAFFAAERAVSLPVPQCRSTAHDDLFHSSSSFEINLMQERFKHRLQRVRRRRLRRPRPRRAKSRAKGKGSPRPPQLQRLRPR
ncbi:timeless-domain-containing protein [Meredithblackwellia eburnea MCA 4105]